MVSTGKLGTLTGVVDVLDQEVRSRQWMDLTLSTFDISNGLLCR